MPQSWHLSTAIFIPKPGKESYSKPKSFRPISLAPFLLKGLERVVAWYLEETMLKKRWRDISYTFNSVYRPITVKPISYTQISYTSYIVYFNLVYTISRIHHISYTSISYTPNLVYFNFGKGFTGNDPTMWTLLSGLRRDIAVHDFEITLTHYGRPRSKKPKYVELAERLAAAVLNYDRTNACSGIP